MEAKVKVVITHGSRRGDTGLVWQRNGITTSSDTNDDIVVDLIYCRY